MLGHKIKISLLLLTLSSLYAQELKDVEVYAKTVTQNENNVTLSGDILINYDSKMVTAKDGLYNSATRELKLLHNVTIVDSSGKKINAKEITINLNSNNIKFKSFFEIDKQGIWIAALEADKISNKIELQNALFSSCSVGDPDWKIAFDKAKYNTASDDLELYNAVFYIKSLPVMYMPYMYLPLSKKRRSGFLIPSFDYIGSEGYMYNQPYFWAIDKSKDLEINTQIRTSRGVGIFATFRFVDNNDSSGKIKVGYFRDNDSYRDKYSLKYKNHYGAELYYKNNSLFDGLSKKGYENKLYINGIYLRDKEYLNLQVNNRLKHHTLGSYYESRANYYIKNVNLYSGISFNYFKDTTVANNDKTIQILPQLTFSLPYRNLFNNNLSYSMQAQITNYTRQEGSKAFKVSLNAPVDFHFSMLNDYLNVDITHELAANWYDFYNVPLNQKQYSSIVINSTIGLSTDIYNSYSFGDLISMYSATYTKSSILSQNYMKYKEIPKELKDNFIDDIPFNSKATFRTHQYLKMKNGININYALEAHYYPKESKLKDLTQEINLKYNNYSLHSKINYSLTHSQATDIYNTIGYNSKKFGLNFGYLWKKDITSFQTTTKELSFNGYYNYNDNLKFKTNIAYNIKDKLVKNWEIDTLYKRKCWSIDVAIGQNRRPVIQSDNNSGAITNKYIKLQLKLLPFGG